MDNRIKLLRQLLRRMRNTAQDGYADVRDGKFERSRALPAPTVDELDALFSLAGLVPDEIQINGTCRTCVFGCPDGGDQGWSTPCCSCARPKMTNFVPLARVRASALRLTKTQETYLRNVHAGRWWATGIMTAPVGTEARERQRARCEDAREAMYAADMVRQSLSHESLTNKGRLALRCASGLALRHAKGWS